VLAEVGRGKPNLRCDAVETEQMERGEIRTTLASREKSGQQGATAVAMTTATKNAVKKAPISSLLKLLYRQKGGPF
jgi:hypothetical protein